MLSPFDWIANPNSLLEVITKENSTLCWLPNFVYSLFGKRLSEDEVRTFDLRSIRAFINCSEPILALSHERFLEKLKPAGVTSEMLQTCYAMAENTFAVTQSELGKKAYEEEIDEGLFLKEGKAFPPREKGARTRRFISSGKLIPENKVRIVGKTGEALPERFVGEIAIQSPSMLTGYYHREDLTKAAILEGWYFTGDLGYLSGGQLFVTGRKKDMIIVAGKNIYPLDIEEIVSGVPGVHPGRVVAFGVLKEEIGTEEVVILAETTESDRKRERDRDSFKHRFGGPSRSRVHG